MTPNEFYRRFVSAEKIKRYAFGTNEFADNINLLAPLDGFIDDYTDHTTRQGIPIIRLGDVEPHSLVVSCVTNSRPITALKKLQDAGIVHYIDYLSFSEAGNGSPRQIPVVTETRLDYQEHKEEYQKIRQMLADPESTHAFDSIMSLRLKGDLQSMKEFKYTPQQQYFEPFYEFTPEEVFVDGGGFDGATSKEFARRCPNYASIHFFEPTNKSMEIAKKNLVNLQNIFYHQVGLFNTADILSFDTNSGSACHISKTGNQTIRVNSLDDAVPSPVTFIKLDLEGAELYALEGMRNHIRRDHPKLAVSVYHSPSHLWEVPKLILGVRTDYKIYLRHYTEGWAETFMFFIPE